MTREVYEELWTRGCIEVDFLPRPNLRNPIHDIFRLDAFTDLNEEEYEFIEPAVRLASRFITEDEYMGFWTQLCTGQLADDSRPGKQFAEEVRLHVLEETTDNNAVTRAQAHKAFSDLADCLTFFIMDEEWSENGSYSQRAAEMFIDPISLRCTYKTDMEPGVDCESGECLRCDATVEARCYVCGANYYRNKSVGQLCGLLSERHIPHRRSRRDKQLYIDLLEEFDEAMEGKRSEPVEEYRVTDEQLSDIRIGLRYSVKGHIDEALAGKTWSRSQEIRFQFALAATLVHELAHAFWCWAQRQCFHCEAEEPWWSDTERKDARGPELGNSWEFWAFASRVPFAGKLLKRGDNKPYPDFFQRFHWNWVEYTEGSGQSRRQGLGHDLILPVEYINSWFRESTWNKIRIKGREVGRPSHDGMVVLRKLATRMTIDENDEESIDEYWCDIEPYNYAALMAIGGFASKKRNFLYGTSGLLTKQDAEDHVEGLRQAARRRRDEDRPLPQSSIRTGLGGKGPWIREHMRAYRSKR